MKHLLGRIFTPAYYSEVIALKNLILQNWWHHGCERYFDFSKKCKTSVGFMADELGEAIRQHKSGTLSEGEVADKFRYTLDLLDYYSQIK